jgi:hypothetical protein
VFSADVFFMVFFTPWWLVKGLFKFSHIFILDFLPFDVAFLLLLLHELKNIKDHSIRS